MKVSEGWTEVGASGSDPSPRRLAPRGPLENPNAVEHPIAPLSGCDEPSLIETMRRRGRYYVRRSASKMLSMRVLIARTSISSASTRPASRAICQPLNSAPAAASADVTAVTMASASMPPIVPDCSAKPSHVVRFDAAAGGGRGGSGPPGGLRPRTCDELGPRRPARQSTPAARPGCASRTDELVDGDRRPPADLSATASAATGVPGGENPRRAELETLRGLRAFASRAELRLGRRDRLLADAPSVFSEGGRHGSTL